MRDEPDLACHQSCYQYNNVCVCVCVCVCVSVCSEQVYTYLTKLER